MTTSSTVSGLVPVRSGSSGMANLTRKELGQWWSTKLGWIQAALWILILNGISLAIMSDPSLTGQALVDEAVGSFFLVAATAVGIGVILSVQGAIVGERELGTAAWVMSKPVSRWAFVLSKLTAHSVGFFVTALLVPAVVLAVQARALLPLPISYASLAGGLGVVALSVVFYLALTLALGTLFRGRGPVAGIGIGLILTGQFFKGMLPLGFVKLTPWLLGDIASSVALDRPLGVSWQMPVIVTAGAAVALVALALRRFNREEL